MLTPFQLRVRRALSESPIFGALADASMRWVHRTSVRKGEVLFEKGEPSDAFYGVVSGQVKLFAESENGRSISFGLAGPGELVGEIGVSGHVPRHASVVALSHCELARVRRRDFEAIVACHPEIQEQLNQAALESALRISQRVEDAAFLTIEARVEKALADFAGRFGEKVDGGIRVAMRQQDLADVLGLSRESVNRVLTSGPISGRVELARGRIVLLGSR